MAPFAPCCVGLYCRFVVEAVVSLLFQQFPAVAIAVVIANDKNAFWNVGTVGLLLLSRVFDLV